MPNQLEETLGIIQRQKKYLMSKLDSIDDSKIKNKVLEELEELTKEEENILKELKVE